MRPRLIVEENQPSSQIQSDTYDRVRRTLDDALAELELPMDALDADDRSAPHRL